jgi:hypothetical protein
MNCAEEERDEPAPAEELVLREGREGAERDGRQNQPGGGARLRPASGEAALVLGGVLDRHQHRSAPLPADREALDQAEDHEQHRGENTDLCVARQQTDRDRRRAHPDEAVDQHRLAADLVTEVTEHDSADRPGEEPGREGAERGDRAGQAREAGEEERVEHQRGGGAVEEEVVPFHGGADEAGEDHSSGHRGRIRRCGRNAAHH